MRVSLWGYYGVNYGDNIMLEVLLKYFYEKKIKVDLIDMYSGKLEVLVNTEYSNVNVVPFIKYTKFQKIKTLIKLSKNKINIWGGGTIFTDQDGDGNFRYFSIIKRLWGQFGYIGVGIGDLNNRERINKTSWLLKRSKFIVFRDKKSLDRANEYAQNKYLLAEDLAFLFFENYEKKTKNEESKYLLVTWRNLVGYMSGEDENQLMSDLVDYIEKVKDKYECNKIILAALDQKYDVSSCIKLNNLLTKKGLESYFDRDSSVHNITNLIAKSTFHISGRLHGSMASEIFNIPTISLSYSPKMEYFYNSIQSSNYINIYKEKINIKNIEYTNRNFNLNLKAKEAMLNLQCLDEILKD